MYIDLIVIIVLLLLVIFVFKSFSKSIYFFAIIDIFLRILSFIKNNSVPELHNLIAKYFPENIPAVIGKYTNGIVFTIFMWIYVIIFCIFLFYTTRIFFKKR